MLHYTTALDILSLKIHTLQVDLVSQSAATNQHESIQQFVQGTIADGAPVIPISAQLKYNVDVVCEYIAKKIPVPVRCVIDLI